MVFFRSNSEIKTKLRQNHGIYHFYEFFWVFLSIQFLSISVSAQSDVSGPVFVQEPPNQMDFSNTTGAEIICQSRGTPLPQITWVKTDGSVVQDVPGLRQVGWLTFLGTKKINHNLTLWSISSTKLQRFNSNLSLYAPNIVNSSPHQKWWSKVSNFDFEILFPDAPFSRV